MSRPEREPHPFDAFYEQQTRLSVATHAMIQLARRLAAARALSQPLGPLFDELEVLIMVERREAEALAGAYVQLRLAIADAAPLVTPVPT